MRVLLDESVPRRLAVAFPESFGTRTVQPMGWAGCRHDTNSPQIPCKLTPSTPPRSE